MTNQAVVQICQGCLVLFFILVALGVVHARLHLPKSKWEPLWDIMMVGVIMVYAVVLKIYFST